MTRSISPREAHARLGDEPEAVYVDVRTVQEFEQGHPAGAWNVPLFHSGTLGMRPNPEFLDVAQKVLAKGAPLMIGCKSGQRSLMAAQALTQAGFADVVNVDGGFLGSSTCPGWQASGLPVAAESAPGTSWTELRERALGA